MKITKGMIDAGADVIEEWRHVLASFELARAVYTAMKQAEPPKTLAERFDSEEVRCLWHERMQSPSRELPPDREARYLELTPPGTKAIVTPGVETYLLFPDGSKFSVCPH